jgi:hypothetical protein
MGIGRLLIVLLFPVPAFAADPTCSRNSPAFECYEAALAQVGTIRGQMLAESASMRQTIDDLNHKIVALQQSSVPSTSIAYFNARQCPPTWHEADKLRGRYVVGMVPGGTLEGSDGKPLGNMEDRPTGDHTHQFDYATGHRNEDVSDGHTPGIDVSSYARTDSAQGRTFGVASGVQGTNAPYVQYLACMKD